MQFFADADDVDAWMIDTLRLVSSEDVGKDEASVQSLIKKHKEVTDELKNYESTIAALHEQAANLGEQVSFSYFPVHFLKMCQKPNGKKLKYTCMVSWICVCSVLVCIIETLWTDGKLINCIRNFILSKYFDVVQNISI